MKLKIGGAAVLAAMLTAPWQAAWTQGSAKDLPPERTGEQVVKAQCIRCHGSGVRGAPKIGDRDAWLPRMKQGLDYLVRSAIRGHGGMPPRGGQANLTDPELRSAVLYMFYPAGVASRENAGAAEVAAVSRAGPNHELVGGMEIYLGIVPAKVLRSFPKDSMERSMHGGVPTGADYYHLNVSLVDAKTQAPVKDARVEVRVEQPGMSGESKALEAMGVGAASFGNYVQLQPKTKYLITVKVRAPEWPQGVEATFQPRVE